ncbi:hypothetical protein ACRALDRAFT_211436 [Sodiomyces alcalophilus JCM 7366]|uniref:uncharacterized protein n=1 Tax=Sodiomyces alcalophilus JCM 7366 TaxID=591952 RepID=UPI0039B37F9A
METCNSSIRNLHDLAALRAFKPAVGGEGYDPLGRVRVEEQKTRGREGRQNTCRNRVLIHRQFEWRKLEDDEWEAREGWAERRRISGNDGIAQPKGRQKRAKGARAPVSQLAAAIGILPQANGVAVTSETWLSVFDQDASIKSNGQISPFLEVSINDKLGTEGRERKSVVSSSKRLGKLQQGHRGRENEGLGIQNDDGIFCPSQGPQTNKSGQMSPVRDAWTIGIRVRSCLDFDCAVQSTRCQNLKPNLTNLATESPNSGISLRIAYNTSYFLMAQASYHASNFNIITLSKNHGYPSTNEEPREKKSPCHVTFIPFWTTIAHAGGETN